MIKSFPPESEPCSGEANIFCGIDVGAETLVVAVQPDQHREFPNSSCGHRQLIAWLGKFGFTRVTLEATGIYWLDLGLALDAAAGIECAVLNPKSAHNFAKTLGRRSKTDKLDAKSLAEYSRRMDFIAWRRPSLEALQLRSLSRHIESLTIERVRDSNRLHAAEATASTPRCVLQDLRRSLKAMEKRIRDLRSAAVQLIRTDEVLRQQFQLLIAMPGIADISAVHLLGELAALPSGLSVREWVAYSGLDPAHQVSGTSVHKPSRISRSGSRHLRRALYMPALVASRRDPHLRAFYQTLLSRHKAKLQALIAVARKILHAIYGIFKHQTPYNGALLFPNLIPTD